MAAIAAGAYWYGKSQHASELQLLSEEIDSLRKGEMDAAIVKRVSQQMEDIAYQQKSISDKQRERAEEQSALAIQMRDRAEQESHAARQAEDKAIKALEEANVQRNLAQEQQQIAEHQKNQALHAKNVSDTLSYRALSRTLASSALTQYDAGNQEIASLLAYSSWYFLDKYDGNTYQPETFKALTTAAGAMRTKNINNHGSITSLATMNHNGIGCVAVSDYGDIDFWQGERSKSILADNKYYFRDVFVEGETIYALSHHGPLCITGFDKKLTTIALPYGDYFKILKTGSNSLLIAARNFVCWYDMTKGTVSSPIKLNDVLTRIGMKKQTILLFFKGGKFAEMDLTGKVTEKQPLTNGVISAYYYDEKDGCLFLGKSNGDIDVLNKYNRKICTLTGHVSRVTDINMVDNILITTAFDKTLYIWELNRVQFESGNTWRQELNMKSSVKSKVKSQNIANEWLIPVDYKFEGWPMSLCVCSQGKDKYTLWTGVSNGQMMRMSVSVDQLSKIVHNKLKRNFTEEEWNHFIGTNVEYQKFK